MAKRFCACVIDAHQVASVVRNRIDNVLILDSRSFLEYNASHVINAINVGCAKLMKRRLQQDKISIRDFLFHSCHWNVEADVDIIVYDQNTVDLLYLPTDSFLYVFLQKLCTVYNSVNVLKGGFLEFQACYPNLCEDEKAKYTPLTSLSQPCLPISDHGPTRILSFLYLGSQHDALNKEVLQNHNISYELNVSTNCPKPDFIQEAHFMRIPVFDNYSEKLLPYFPKAFQFLDKVRESGGCALVHCLAGISRSATVAIAYVMQHLKMSSDEAYRYVKSKRSTISPNFNFLGQLLEYEKQLRRDNILCSKPDTPNETSGLRTPLCNEKCNRELLLGHGTVQIDSNAVKKNSLLEVPSFSSQVSRNLLGLQRPGMNSCFKSTNDSHLLMKGVANITGSPYYKLSTEKCEGIETESWSSKCIPLSSLNELNFTPCQAGMSNGTKSTKCFARESNSWSAGDSYIKTTITLPSPTVSLDSLQDKKCNPNFDSPLFDSLLDDYKSEALKNADALPLPVWCMQEVPVLSQMQQDEFDPKEYTRSDSTSTSGLGSEESDCLDSWNDYHSSYERETDMDDDFGSVPMEDSDYQRKMLEFQHSFEETSLYGKYEDTYYGDRNSKNQGVPSKKIFNMKYSSMRKCTDFAKSNESQRMNENSLKQYGVAVEHITSNNQKCIDEAKLKKSDGLYRAQSCPGIISQDATMQPSSFNHIQTVTVRRTRKPNSERACENRNRYSCSSLDYMEYVPDIGVLKSDTNDTFSSFSRSDSVAPMSPPHQIFRHSMIQVS